MKTSTLLNLSVLCLQVWYLPSQCLSWPNTLQAVASLIPDHDPLAGREVTVPEWDVEVTPGGEKVTLRGTIEEVHAQLLERNPNWDEDFPEQVEDLAERDLGEEGFTPIEKRTDFSGSKYFCYARWPTTARARIVEGISYLRRVRGKPSLRAGPGRCSRVSCSWNAAIYWCNDVS